MGIRGRFILLISAVFAGPAVGKEYNYEFGSDVGEEFFNKTDILVDPETEIIIPAPNGIEEKFVKISVISEDEPQVNATFGYPFLRATIRFDRAQPPGGYFTVSAKGVVTALNQTLSDAGAASDSAAPAPNAEANETAPYLVAVPNVDDVALAAVNESAAAKVAKEYNYEFVAGSDANIEFYNKRDSLIEQETEVAIPAPSGIEQKFVKISVISEDEPQVNVTFGYPFIKARIKFDHAQPPGGYYIVSAKGVVKAFNETLSDPGADSAAPNPNAEANKTASDPVAVNNLDGSVSAAANESAVSNATTESGNAAQPAAVDGVVPVNQSDSAANETAVESNTVPDISPIDIRQPVGPESISAAENQPESDTPAAENATPPLAADFDNLTLQTDVADSSANQSESVTPVTANETATPAIEIESNSTASVDGRRSAGSDIFTVDESNRAAPAENGTVAIEHSLTESAVNASVTASPGANNSGSAGESGSSLLAASSDILNAAVAESTFESTSQAPFENSISANFESSTAALTAAAGNAGENVLAGLESADSVSTNGSTSEGIVDQVDEANAAVLQAEAAAPVLEAAAEPALATAATVPSDSSPASVPDYNTDVLAAPAPYVPVLIHDSDFAQAAIAEFANAAQAAIDNALFLPQTSAVENANIPAPIDANNAAVASDSTIQADTAGSRSAAPDEELNLTLSLN